jgi:hypothetical protein
MTERDLTDEEVRAFLKREWPQTLEVEVDRMLKTCRTEAWFQKAWKSKRLSGDLKTGGAPPNKTPAVYDGKYGKVPPKFHDDPDEEPAKPGRERDIRAAEWAVRLLLEARTDRVRHMRASIALQLFKNELNLAELAKHFDVTPQRVKQVINEVNSFQVSDDPQ